MSRATDIDPDTALALDAKVLWPRVRGQFTDPRLHDLIEDLESSAIERVLKERQTLTGLRGADREAAIVRALTLGAVDEARRTTGSGNSHVRKRVEHHAREHLQVSDRDRDEDANITATELLEMLNLTGEERLIAGCYALGCRSPRDIAYVIDESPAYVSERLRTLLPYMRGMLADHVAPGLDEGTRQLICRYAQGDLHSSRRWRERHNARRLVANNPDCLRLWRAQCATDNELRILVPLPTLAGLVAQQAASGTSEHAVHAAALREHIADASAGFRRHAAALYHRAIDPTPVAGMRPGAAGAVLASCLTIGGGAGYCINEGVNPLRAIDPAKTPIRHKPVAKVKRARPSHRLARLATPVHTAGPAVEPSPVSVERSRSPAQNHAAEVAAPSPPPQGEFEAPKSSTSRGASAASPSTPAPASGPGEFGP